MNLLFKIKITLIIVLIFVISSCYENSERNSIDIEEKENDFENGNRSHKCKSFYFPGLVHFKPPVYLKKNQIKKLFFPYSNNINKNIEASKHVKKYITKSLYNIVLSYISGFEKYTEEIFDSITNKHRDLNIIYVKIFDEKIKNKIIKLNNNFYISITNNDLDIYPYSEEQIIYCPIECGPYGGNSWDKINLKNMGIKNYTSSTYEKSLYNNENKILVKYNNNNNCLAIIHNRKYKRQSHLIYKFNKKNKNKNNLNCIHFNILPINKKQEIINSITNCIEVDDVINTRIFEKHICCYHSVIKTFILKEEEIKKYEKEINKHKNKEFYFVGDTCHYITHETKSIHILYNFKSKNRILSFLNSKK